MLEFDPAEKLVFLIDITAIMSYPLQLRILNVSQQIYKK